MRVTFCTVSIFGSSFGTAHLNHYTPYIEILLVKYIIIFITAWPSYKLCQICLLMSLLSQCYRAALHYIYAVANANLPVYNYSHTHTPTHTMHTPTHRCTGKSLSFITRDNCMAMGSRVDWDIVRRWTGGCGLVLYN